VVWARGVGRRRGRGSSLSLQALSSLPPLATPRRAARRQAMSRPHERHPRSPPPPAPHTSRQRTQPTRRFREGAPPTPVAPHTDLGGGPNPHHPLAKTTLDTPPTPHPITVGPSPQANKRHKRPQRTHGPRKRRAVVDHDGSSSARGANHPILNSDAYGAAGGATGASGGVAGASTAGGGVSVSRLSHCLSSPMSHRIAAPQMMNTRNR
jgi:hypothetical protein